MDGRDVYSIMTRLFFTHVFAQGTQGFWQRMVTYRPNVRAGGGCC